MRRPLHRYRGKVGQRQGGAAGIDRTGPDPPAQDRGDLEIEQFGVRQPGIITSVPGAGTLTLGAKSSD